MEKKQWELLYEQRKENLRYTGDLEVYFREKEIKGVRIDQMDLGTLVFPTGQVLACDPLTDLGKAFPYLQKIPSGTYPVQVCVIPSEQQGDQYACVKVKITDQKPVRYDLAITGQEEFGDWKEGMFFGFSVDSGMGCIADLQAQKEFRRYEKQMIARNPDWNPYDDLFCKLLEGNYQYGDWLNWTVPGGACNLVLFSSGWGDGVYPAYFGLDEDGAVCGIYIHLIDIETAFEA